MRRIPRYCFFLFVYVLTGCSLSVPKEVEKAMRDAAVFPDYKDAVIPPNIAPLNFLVEEDGEEYLTHIYTSIGKEDIIIKGKEVGIPQKKWRLLLEEAKGDTVFTDVYVKKSGIWMLFTTRKNPVAIEEIDPYITYRLIEPSYVDYEGMTLQQRDLTNFEEVVLYNNMMLSDGDNGQCVNCHSVQDYNRSGCSQFHVRQNYGGTVLTLGSEVRKVNLSTEHTLSAGVYPAWHPMKRLIAYSVNETGQVFHTRDIQKVEVLDFASDLILYDIEGNNVYDIDCRPDEFETFPAWSPDGCMLYYSSAHYEQQTDDIDAELGVEYKTLKYNIYRRRFDSDTMKFGRREMVFDASAIGKSAVLPRVSPDGRYLLFALADYGNFHIWHKSSDLYVLKLSAGDLEKIAMASDISEAVYPLVEANSDEAESYHSWSSNGRWILFSSRRMDGIIPDCLLLILTKKGGPIVRLLFRKRTPFIIVSSLKVIMSPNGWLFR